MVISLTSTPNTAYPFIPPSVHPTTPRLIYLPLHSFSFQYAHPSIHSSAFTHSASPTDPITHLRSLFYKMKICSPPLGGSLLSRK